MLRLLNDSRTAREYIQRNRNAIRQLYVTSGLTAKVVADRLGVEPNRNWIRELAREFPKGMGHGGPRLGSGNKKGVKWCSQCKKAMTNCQCERSSKDA